MAPSRKFVDSEGIHWQVYELADEARTSERGWLYFFSRDATRSLVGYPDDWASMDWPGLERLCQRAMPPVRRESSVRPLRLPQTAEA